jgi:hypothetical protein
LLPVLSISASGNTQYEVTQASLLWAMAAALDLHREVALPVPLHKGLAPSVLPSASADAYAVFAKFSARYFCKKSADTRYIFLQKFRLSAFVSAFTDRYGFAHYVTLKAVTFLSATA